MRILIIEDQLKVAQSLQHGLESERFDVTVASTGEDGFFLVSSQVFDLLILDLMLPDGNGFEILKEMKGQNKTDGIIIISAKENLETRLEGFKIGADDYLTKPFHLSELLVRIQALIRRKKFNGNNIVVFSEIKIDILSKNVKVNNKTIDITKKEIDLLLYLIGNENRVLSKAAIAEHLSGDMADMLDNHDFVYAHVKNLKKKLSDAGGGDYIKSVYGLGYKWKNA